MTLRKFFITAAIFEISLALIAGILIWIFHDDFSVFHFEFGEGALNVLGLGLFSAFVLAMVMTSRWSQRFGTMRKIHRVIRNFLGGEIVHLNLFQLGVISLCAGVGEELLFRGALEPLLGFWVTNLLFGAAHPLTLGYFFFAFGMGSAMSWLMAASGSVWVPVLVHAFYDWVALGLMKRRFLHMKEAEF